MADMVYGAFLFLSLLLRDVPCIFYIWKALRAAVILVPLTGLLCAVTGTSPGKVLKAPVELFRHLFRPPDR